MRPLAALLLLASCTGRVESECLAPPFGSFEATLTVVETNCLDERVGDVTTGRVDLIPGACPVVDCAIVCSEGPTETTWTATGPGEARVVFEGGCRAVYRAELVTE